VEIRYVETLEGAASLRLGRQLMLPGPGFSSVFLELLSYIFRTLLEMFTFCSPV